MSAPVLTVVAETVPPSFRDILEGVAKPILVIDAADDITFANAAAQETFGNWIVDEETAVLFPQFLRSMIKADAETTMVLATKSDGEFDAQIRPIGGGNLVVSLNPRIHSTSSYNSDLDELTGLSRRKELLDQLGSALAREPVDGSTFAIHCVDLDRFKLVNDTLGHSIGDLLLSKVAGRLRTACRRDDLIARVGGDEFVVVQWGIGSLEDAERLANRLVELISRTYIVNGHTVNIGTSIGVAFPTPDLQPRDLLHNGDLALYEAKRAGKAQYCVFEPSMDASLRQRRELEIDLRRALALRQFDLNFQPFLDLSSNEITGFEALLRWNHPVRGRVSPADFIPLAEETGLIVKIGEWVMRTACKVASGWPDHMTIAVNVSPVQFKSGRLLDIVSAALQSADLPASRLELEITEGTLLDDTDSVLSTLHALKDLGVKISMDDFGTGYSSLSYLRKFPFSKIKIDRSFIQGVETGGEGEAILKAVVGLGTGLGMAITAEGVETAEQLTRIREERCTLVQGFFTGRPMVAADIATFLKR